MPFERVRWLKVTRVINRLFKLEHTHVLTLESDEAVAFCSLIAHCHYVIGRTP